MAEKAEPKILKQFPNEELPPPGDARRDALKARQENLDREKEKFDSQVELEAMTPESMEVIPEVAQQVHMLRLRNPDPEYDYCWANCRAANGIKVDMKEVEGWEIVRSSHPESKGQRIDEFGRCRVGDAVLMRLRKDASLALKRRDRAKRLAMQAGVGSDLEALADKFGVNARPLTPQEMQRMAAKQIAGQRFNQMLRTGSVPGMQTKRGG